MKEHKKTSAFGIGFGLIVSIALLLSGVFLVVKRFLIATAGNPVESNFNAITKIIKNMNCRDIGHFICRGFDTFGPLKLIGGIQKGHPTEEEIQAAVDFYNSII